MKNSPFVKIIVYIVIAGTVFAYVPLFFKPRVQTQNPSSEGEQKQVVVPVIPKEKESKSAPTSTQQNKEGANLLESFSDLTKENESFNALDTTLKE